MLKMFGQGAVGTHGPDVGKIGFLLGAFQAAAHPQNGLVGGDGQRGLLDRAGQIIQIDFIADENKRPFRVGFLELCTQSSEPIVELFLGHTGMEIKHRGILLYIRGMAHPYDNTPIVPHCPGKMKDFSI